MKHGTPAEMQDTVARVWTVCPKPERIVQDMWRCYMFSVGAILAANGLAVKFAGKRKGRRGGKFEHEAGVRSKRKPASRELSSFPLHDDAAEVLAERTAALVAQSQLEDGGK